VEETKINMPFLPSFDDSEDEFSLEDDFESNNEPATPDQRVQVAIRTLRQMRQQLDNVLDMLERGKGTDLDSSQFTAQPADLGSSSNSDKVVEGVFDGEKMMGIDGMKYNIPPNYASKSKLVEGDIMKLIIKEDGTFIYKQIGPIDRERVSGTLVVDEYGNFAISADSGEIFKILMASVTYFKGEPGDKIIGLLPKGQKATWAAVENIVKD